MRRFLPFLVLAGCSSEEGGVGWRLPCAGQRFDDGATVASAVYQYEWDGDGHLLREARTESYGGIFSLTQEWEEGVVVLADYEEANGNRYGMTARQSGGRIQTRDVVTWSGVMFHETWTWSGDDLDRIERSYSGWDEVDTYEDTPDGFTVTTCEITDPRPCDRKTVTGAAHRGDFSRWTRYDVDRGDDGLLDQRVERELDPHELVLVEDRYDFGGSPAFSARLVYLREADGTAISENFEWFGAVPRAYVLAYEFDCSSGSVGP